VIREIIQFHHGLDAPEDPNPAQLWRGKGRWIPQLDRLWEPGTLRHWIDRSEEFQVVVPGEEGAFVRGIPQWRFTFALANPILPRDLLAAMGQEDAQPGQAPGSMAATDPPPAIGGIWVRGGGPPEKAPPPKPNCPVLGPPIEIATQHIGDPEFGSHEPWLEGSLAARGRGPISLPPEFDAGTLVLPTCDGGPDGKVCPACLGTDCKMFEKEQCLQEEEEGSSSFPSNPLPATNMDPMARTSDSYPDPAIGGTGPPTEASSSEVSRSGDSFALSWCLCNSNHEQRPPLAATGMGSHELLEGPPQAETESVEWVGVTGEHPLEELAESVVSIDLHSQSGSAPGGPGEETALPRPGGVQEEEASSEEVLYGTRFPEEGGTGHCLSATFAVNLPTPADQGSAGQYDEGPYQYVQALSEEGASEEDEVF